MSRPDYGSMLERFNATGGRGDVLSFSREDAARLAELPLEIAAPILHALLKWFLTGEDVQLDDPRDRAMLAGFKEHQLGNAARRGKFLNAQKEKSDLAVQARKERNPRDTHGTPTDNPRETQVIDKAKDKDSVKEKSLSLAGDGTERGGLTPPVCPSPLSAEEAKKVLAMDAPEVMSHAASKTSRGDPTSWTSQYLNHTATGAAAMVVADLYPRDIELGMFEDVDEIDTCDIDDTTKGGKFLCDLIDLVDNFNGQDPLFHRALRSAHLASKSPSIKNRNGFIIARLQKVAAAVRVLEAAKSRPSKEPLSDADY